MKSMKRFSLSGKPPAPGNLTPTGYPNEKANSTQGHSGPSSIDESQPQAAPPSYTAVDADQPPPGEAGPSLEELVGNFSNLRIAPGLLDFPTTDLALAHLKLLETLFQLKLEIGYTDGLFGFVFLFSYSPCHG